MVCMCHTCEELVLLFSQIRRIGSKSSYMWKMVQNRHTCEELLILSGMERIAKFSSHLWPGFYCASCKEIMTPVVASSSSTASHFLIPIENSWRYASISFKLYERVRHHKIQVNIDKGGNPHIVWVMALFWLRFWLNCQFVVSGQ